MSLDLPEERLFDSKDELIDYCKEHAISQGYAVSKAGGGDSRKGYLKCDRGRIYESQSRGLRSSSSRLQGCPFKLYGAATKNDEGRWRLRVKVAEHNHDASKNLASHPSARRFSARQQNFSGQLSSTNIPARFLTTALRATTPGALFIAWDVYNARAKARKDLLDGRTPTQALLTDLKARNYALKYRCCQSLGVASDIVRRV